MKNHILFLSAFLIFVFGCKNEPNPFLIGKNQIGFLTDSSAVKNLKTIFPNDSVVNYQGDAKFNLPMNMVEVYEKGGKLLLILTPKAMKDSSSTITNIRINDPRYKTDKGISTQSRFKDIQAAYKISKIDNLINTIVVSVNEIDAQFAIEKTELPANLRYDMNLKIESSQIPDMARIKYFFVNWD